MVGAGFVGASWLGLDAPASAGDAPPPTPSPTPTAPVSRPPTAPKKNQLHVAPNILDALIREGAGRGSYGCDAVDPPTFISEADGVEILQQELRKAGLTLASRPAPTVAVRLPRTTENRHEELPGHTGTPRSAFHARPVEFAFDGASADGRVVFEFVSHDDYRAWGDPDDPLHSSVGTVHLADAARRLAESLAEVPDAKRRAVVLVVDPMTRYRNVPIEGDGLVYPKWKEPHPDRAAFKDDEAYMVANRAYWKAQEEDEAFQSEWAAYRKAYQRRVAEAGREAIRRQLAPQLEFLRAEGLLPPVLP